MEKETKPRETRDRPGPDRPDQGCSGQSAPRRLTRKAEPHRFVHAAAGQFGAGKGRATRLGKQASDPDAAQGTLWPSPISNLFQVQPLRVRLGHQPSALSPHALGTATS